MANLHLIQPSHVSLHNERYFDHAISVGRISNTRYNKGHLCFWEDDAIIKPDFIQVMNEHLALLPDDWQIFFAGWTNIFDPVGDDAIITARVHWGLQCMVVRDICRDALAGAIFTHEIFKYGNGGIDTLIPAWCKDTGRKYFYPKKSFVGQHDCVSGLVGHFRPLAGLEYYD